MSKNPGKTVLTRQDLEAHWMPYTGNRQLKENPRIIVGAEGPHLADALREAA